MTHFPLRHRRTLLATLVAALAHGTAFAEEAPPVSDSATPAVAEAQLPNVSVTAPALSDSQPENRADVDPETARALRPATSDSASLLRNVPGLNLQGAGGVSSLPVVHGLADDRLRIKVDGMDLISACGNHMNPPLSYVDPTNVESAKVFAGITPVSLGGDSIGSTIQVESPAPPFAKAGEGVLHEGEVGAFYRSNGEARGGNLAATLASESLSLSYRGSTAEANDYKAGGDFKTDSYVNDVGDRVLESDEVGSTMYKTTNQSLALGMRQENHLVELKLGKQDIPYQGYPNQRMDMTGNDSTQTNLRYEGQYGWGDMEARVYHEHTRHKMQFFDDKLYWYGATPAKDGIPCTPSGGMTGCAAGMPMDTEGNNSGLMIKGDLSLSARDLVRVGTEAQNYRLDDWWDPSGKGMWPDTFWNIHDGERDRLALFSEWEAQWKQQWLTQIGLRYEKVDMNTGEVQGYNTSYDAEAAAFNAADRADTDHNFDLTTLARFTPDAQRTVELGYARKTRSPNLYERYTWSTGGMAMRMINWSGDGNGYVGNLELRPEVAHTVSATFDWHDAAQKAWGIAVTPYFTHVSDYIDAERCGPSDTLMTSMAVCNTANLTATDSFVYLKFVNQTARIYGVDISGHYPLAENTRYGSFTTTGLVNYVHGENRATGDNLYNIMPLNAKLAIKQRLSNWTNTIEAEGVDAKTDVSETRNEMETAGYGLLHLRSSYAWKQARFDVGIENLLDRLYNHPLGGAYLGQGKTMSGTDVAWGTPVPGMGRSIYAGVNVKF
ncbi:MAG TPA: TonB-dependent receptor [Gammaproteobacteria bacterium]